MNKDKEVTLLQKRIKELEKSESERNKAEEELEKYREHLEELVEERTSKLEAQKKFTDNVIDSLPDTFYIFDPESGKGIRWNKTLNEISGYNYKEMKEYPPSHFYPPEEHELIEEIVKTTLEKGRAIVELNYIIADGTRIPFEYSTVLIKDAEGKSCICVIGRDITERKQAEEELKKHRDHLEELVEERTAELRENEEKLKSTNQQLRASEQQLKASNQQLRADEQQLRAEIAERKRMEEETKKHLHDLEVFYKANIGREERVLELKKRVKGLEAKLGKKTG